MNMRKEVQEEGERWGERKEPLILEIDSLKAWKGVFKKERGRGGGGGGKGRGASLTYFL